MHAVRTLLACAGLMQLFKTALMPLCQELGTTEISEWTGNTLAHLL